MTLVIYVIFKQSLALYRSDELRPCPLETIIKPFPDLIQAQMLKHRKLYIWYIQTYLFPSPTLICIIVLGCVGGGNFDNRLLAYPFSICAGWLSNDRQTLGQRLIISIATHHFLFHPVVLQLPCITHLYFFVRFLYLSQCCFTSFS